MQKRGISSGSTNLEKEGIRSGTFQNMLSVTPNDEIPRKPILPLEVLRKIAATVTAIKQRLASEQRNIVPEQIASDTRGQSRSGEEQSGEASGSDSGKNLENEP